MPIIIATSLSLHTNNDNESNWDGTNGPDTYDVSIEGLNSESWLISKNASETGTLTLSASLPSITSGAAFIFWMKSDLSYYYTSVKIRLISSTGNYKEFTIATDISPKVSGDFKPFALDYMTRGTETGTFVPTSLTSIEITLDNSSSGNIRSVINTWIDAMWYGELLKFTGDTVEEKLFAEMAELDESGSKFGALENYEGKIFVQNNIEISSDGEQSQYSTNETLVFKATDNGLSNYSLLFSGLSRRTRLNGTDIEVNEGAMLNVKIEPTFGGKFSMTGGSFRGLGASDITEGDFDGVNFIGRGNISFNSEDSGMGISVNNCLFHKCGYVSNGIYSPIVNSKFFETTDTNMALAVIDLSHADGCEFIRNPTQGNVAVAEIIELTEDKTTTWNCITSGYAEVDGLTGEEVIYVNVAENITLTIEVADGISPPSIFNAGLGSVVVISGLVTLTLTGLPNGIEVRIRQGSYTIQHTQDVTGNQVSYSYTYVTDKIVSISFTGAGIIQSKKLVFTLGNIDQTSLVTFELDPSYIT